MESVGQNYGFLLYRTQIPQKFANTNVELEILGLRDRGIILVGQVRELSLFTICESLKDFPHSPRITGRREPCRERGCFHIANLETRGKLGRVNWLSKRLLGLLLMPGKNFRHFRVTQSFCFIARLSAKPLVWKNDVFNSYANETHFHKKGFASSLVLKGSFENSKMACCPIVADSWTIRTIPDVDVTENTWTPLLHFISSYCRLLQNNIIWTWNYQI